jgi:hypothetical protein
MRKKEEEEEEKYIKGKAGKEAGHIKSSYKCHFIHNFNIKS